MASVVTLRNLRAAKMASVPFARVSRRLADMTGRTVVVTGANSGLGLETVVALARAGATVVLCSRDPQRGAQALGQAQRRSGSDRIELASLDLASVASIRAFVEGFGAVHDHLDVLVNNAGLGSTSGDSPRTGWR